MNPVQPITIKERQERTTLRLEQLIDRQTQERGINPMPLEHDTLLRRVRDGGWSGEYLAAAMISAYYVGSPFNLTLGHMHRLDAEGFRLFHQILHIRMIPGWSDNDLYALVLEIKQILAKESGDELSSDE